jgi:hypothetical protein
MGRKSASGSGIRDEQPGSYFLELRNHFVGVKILKFFDADPGSGMETVRIRDGKSRIRDPGLTSRIRNTGQRYRSGSGSFHHQARIVRKTLISNVSDFFMTFYL